MIIQCNPKEIEYTVVENNCKCSLQKATIFISQQEGQPEKPQTPRQNYSSQLGKKEARAEEEKSKRGYPDMQTYINNAFHTRT